MGCGSSSLKGDDVPDVNAQPAQAGVQMTTTPAGYQVRKVKTNFSDVNYDDGNAAQRRMTEYAPHETPAPVREESHGHSQQQEESFEVQQSSAPNQQSRTAGGPSATGLYPHANAGQDPRGTDNNPDAPLKPYHTTDGGDWDNDGLNHNNQASHQAHPYVNGDRPQSNDPTSNYAKDQFAANNDPANSYNQEPHHHPNNQAHDGHQDYDPDHHNDTNDNYHDAHEHEDYQAEHKKSWLGQKYADYQTTQRGPGPSDEDVMKYTGKDRQELNDWAQDRPGVGGNQEAGLHNSGNY